jgi:hypothetical protein
MLARIMLCYVCVATGDGPDTGELPGINGGQDG